MSKTIQDYSVYPHIWKIAKHIMDTFPQVNDLMTESRLRELIREGVNTVLLGEPGGLKPGEYMHEWMEEDAVEFDLPTEEILGALVRDNRILRNKLKKATEEK